MQIVIITSEEDDFRETESIIALMEAGVIVHIRKKNKSEKDLLEYLRSFPEKLRSRLTLHGFHQLAEKMNIGGIHLSGYETIDQVRNWKGRLSKSFHSLDCLKDDSNNVFYYGFISPVFDSISKKEYKSTFNVEELTKKLSERRTTFPVYALGGVTLEKLPEIKQLNFDGAAILGNFWNIKNMDERLSYINELKEYVT